VVEVNGVEEFMEYRFEEGEILAGKFRIERRLGKGGMGVVYAAHHLQLDEPVAIKLLLPEAARDHDAIARFMREARAAVKVKSEHVARIIDVARLEDGAPYMVMEYLDGNDLGSVGRDGALPIVKAVGYVLEAIDAIAEAHALGIVHRDLKPSNLFLADRPDGTQLIKVLDFGISKMQSRTGLTPDTMTKSTALLGSPLYMPPEQMKSTRDVDMRADIWSLGAILFELLTGQPPFDADTLPMLFSMVLNEEPARASSLRADVPPELDAVIQTCLRKEPGERFQTIAELAESLVPFGPPEGRLHAERAVRLLAGISTASLRRATLDEQPKERTGKTGWSWLRGASHTSVNRTPWLALGVLAGVVLSGAVAVGVTYGRGQTAMGGANETVLPVASGSSENVPGSASAPPAVSAPAATSSATKEVDGRQDAGVVGSSSAGKEPRSKVGGVKPSPLPPPPPIGTAVTATRPPSMPSPPPTPAVPDYGDRK
jgi:eukaryotic-like serine/threonine-protein kinase